MSVELLLVKKGQRMLANRLDLIKSSPTLAISAKVKQMKRDGIDVVGFGAGEPDFNTPQPIVDAAIKALNEGFTRYTASAGIPELREAISQKLLRENNISYDPSQIVVSCGAKHALFNSVMALCDDGDEVIIARPYWVSYPEMIRLAGAKPVMVDVSESNNFVLMPDDFERAITSRTKALLLNTPNNPTGGIYTKEQLSALAEVCLKHNIIIISDEIYEKLVYNAEHVSIAGIDPRYYDITITVNGVSKAYCMTGWRMGYSAAPKAIAGAISRIQDHSTSCITAFVQKAGVAALNLDPTIIEGMKVQFDSRRRRLTNLLNDISGISCNLPGGAFYVFANIMELFGKRIGDRTITDSFSFAEILLDQAKVAVVPGIAFGSEGFVRLSYCNSMEQIEKGVARIKKLLG